jgi:hypothetical protein
MLLRDLDPDTSDTITQAHLVARWRRPDRCWPRFEPDAADLLLKTATLLGTLALSEVLLIAAESPAPATLRQVQDAIRGVLTEEAGECRLS